MVKNIYRSANQGDPSYNPGAGHLKNSRETNHATFPGHGSGSGGIRRINGGSGQCRGKLGTQQGLQSMLHGCPLCRPRTLLRQLELMSTAGERHRCCAYREEEEEQSVISERLGPANNTSTRLDRLGTPVASSPAPTCGGFFYIAVFLCGVPSGMGVAIS
jgi:hypothetical protein